MDWLTHQLISQQARVNDERSFIEKLLLNLDGGLAYLNASLTYEIVNPCFAQLFDRRPEDFLGRKAFEVLPETDSQLRQIFETVVRTGRPFGATNFPLKYHQNGREIESFWDGTLTPILGDDDKISGLLLLVFNVTDRVLLQQERNTLAAIVDGSFDAIIAADLDGKITHWNESAARIYGYTSEEALGQPISITIPPEANDNMPVALKKISRGERVAFYMTRRVRKNGRRLTVCLAVSPIKGVKGDIVGASLITRDLTEKLEGAPAEVGAASEIVSRWLAPPRLDEAGPAG